MGELRRRLKANDPQIACTLGLSYYRVGEFGKALVLSTDDYAERHDPPHVTNLAVTAMAQWQLGQRDEARASLVQLREFMKDSSWASDEDAKALFAEAVELIEGGAASSEE